MKPFYDESGTTLWRGDCRAVMATMPENFVDTCITDPPYELGFMGKAWDGTGVAFCPDTWRAVLRVCKPGAMLLAFGGTRAFHRLACAIEDAGWEIRDCMMWLYGSGFPKSLDISKAIDKDAGAERELIKTRARPETSGTMAGSSDTRPWIERSRENGFHESAGPIPVTAAAAAAAGWGTALKPAWEPIVVAMKPLDGTFAGNMQRHGVAGLNIAGGRIGDFVNTTPPGTDRFNQANFEQGYRPSAYQGGRKLIVKRPNGIPGNSLSGSVDASLNGSVSAGTTTLGRWPANVLLDEVAAAQLDEMSGELDSGSAHFLRRGQTTGKGIGYGPGSTGEAVADATYGDSGGASRFFYTAKASRSDRGAGNNHPTVKPTDLMKYLCKLTATPTGGVILDPFAGSGTTLVAAREYGRPCIGIELLEPHCRIIVDRLRQLPLFGIA